MSLNFSHKFQRILAYLIIILCLGFIACWRINIKTKEWNVAQKLSEHHYSRFYSNLRLSHLEFDSITRNLNKSDISQDELEKLEEICTFQIEDGIDKIYISKGYDCLAKLQFRKNNIPEILRSIKNISYGLDVIYIDDHAKFLSYIITDKHKELISAELKETDFSKYFSGYSKDEIPFLNKLISLDVPELSAKANYRLSMIHILGRSSSIENTKPDMQKAVTELNETIALTNIKPTHHLNIALTINDQYSPHAAATIASALVNADLDTSYHFYVIMNPEDLVSQDSQQKLRKLQYIRNYKIDFITVDHNLLPVDLIKNKFDWYSAKVFTMLITYRPFLDKILPNVNSVLSLDADLIVLRDLNSFNQINMSHYFLAGVYDTGFLFIGNCYINGGVMWFNLNNMRKENANALVVKAIQDYEEPVNFFEQEVIYSAFPDRIKYLSYRWNSTPKFLNPDNTKNHQSLKFILHYQGIKPWARKSGDKTELEKLYWEYRNLTQWP